MDSLQRMVGEVDCTRIEEHYFQVRNRLIVLFEIMGRSCSVLFKVGILEFGSFRNIDWLVDEVGIGCSDVDNFGVDCKVLAYNQNSDKEVVEEHIVQEIERIDWDQTYNCIPDNNKKDRFLIDIVVHKLNALQTSVYSFLAGVRTEVKVQVMEVDIELIVFLEPGDS